MKVEEFRVAESLDGFRVEREVVIEEEKITTIETFWGEKVIKTPELAKVWRPVDTYGQTNLTSKDIIWKPNHGWLLNIVYYKTLEEAAQEINRLCAKDYPVYYYIQKPKEEENDSRKNNS